MQTRPESKVLGLEKLCLLFVVSSPKFLVLEAPTYYIILCLEAWEKIVMGWGGALDHFQGSA